MVPVLSTTAWVLHDLGLAANFGGSLFGKVGLHPAARAIARPEERGETVERAWKRFSPLNAAALTAVAGTWLVGRTMLTGREVDRTTRTLVKIKDVLVSIDVVSGLAAIAGGYALAREDHGGPPPMQSGSEPARTASGRATGLQRTVDALGYVSLFASAAVLGLTAVLAMRAASSQRFGIVSRFLP